MCAVAAVADAGPAQRTVGAEVIAMNVVDVAVFVVILSVAGDFLGVDPHVGLKVRVVVFHAFIDHRYDDFRIACDDLPYILDVDVSSRVCRSCDAFVTDVDVVPLVLERRVVEDVVVGLGRSGRLIWIVLSVGSLDRQSVVLHDLDASQTGSVLCHCLDVAVF